MIKPDINTLKSLAALEGDKHFINWLKESITHEMGDALHTKDDVLLRWSQGRSQNLREILETVTTARETLKKF